MGFDCSRFTFNPANDYLGVVMQQGRVQLDSDWNEWQAEFARRIQAGTLDAFGRAVYPINVTPDAFLITPNATGSGNQISIGAGRMYVDGLLVENHGVLAPAFIVAAANNLPNATTYGIQITAGNNAGQFNLALYQVTQGSPPQPIGNPLPVTLSNVQAAVANNAALSAYIQIWDVASIGQPAYSAGNGLYMLAQGNSGFQVTIPQPSSQQWDPALGELSGASTSPGVTAATIDYTQQPYYPNPPPIPAGTGSYLIYLDVWRRAVSSLEDPSLIDKAVGIDTTGRLQTVWQVKLLDPSASSPSLTCSTPDDSLPPAWTNLLLPPGLSLTTGVVQSPASGPCCLTSTTGYTGMENQLYRVEIHRCGTPLPVGAATPVTTIPSGTATFKWSRDNGSVTTSVTAIGSTTNPVTQLTASTLTVQSLGRDQVLGFSPGDWIELTDDWLELHGCPGELHQIYTVTPGTLTITLVDAIITSSSFPLTGGQTDPTRHTRIKRWDQSGQIFQVDSQGNQTGYYPLPSSGQGDIPVPPPGTTLVLENGVTVSFGWNLANAEPKTGDFWAFAARTSDGSVEILDQAPPKGIQHHYARLAVVTFPSGLSDCRIPWPPSDSACCDCSATVSPTDLTDANSLQDILDSYQNQSLPFDICLEPGTYYLAGPLRLNIAHSNITLKGCLESAVTFQAQPGNENLFTDGMMVLDGAQNCSIEGIVFSIPAANWSGTQFAGWPLTSMDAQMSAALKTLVVSIGVRAVNCPALTIQNCQFNFDGMENIAASPPVNLFGAGIFVNGMCMALRVEGNQFVGLANFLAGFLATPLVSFNSPPGVNTILENEQPIKNRVEQVVTRALVSSTSAAVKKAAAPAPAPAPAAASGAAKQLIAAPMKMDVSRLPAGVGLKLAAIPSPTTAGVDAIYGRTPIFVQRPVFVFNPEASTPNYAQRGGMTLPTMLSSAIFKGNSFDGFTVAALILGETDGVEFTGNQVQACNAGFWFLTPLQTRAILFDPQNTALNGLAFALGYPLPQGDSVQANASSVTVAAATTVRIYAGGASQTDSQGNTWLPDASASSSVQYSGGTIYVPSPAPTITDTSGQALNPSDQPLYQSERFGNFTYTFPNLSNGYYQVTLKFAEIARGDFAVGKRVFNVTINNQQVLNNFDIYKAAGGPEIAIDQVFANIPVTNQQIVIQFQSAAGSIDQNPKISAVEVLPQWSPGFSFVTSLATRQEPPAVVDFQNFVDQLSMLAQQGFLNQFYNPSNRRLCDNEMWLLSAPGILILDEDAFISGKMSSVIMTGNRLDCNSPWLNTDQIEIFGNDFTEWQNLVESSGNNLILSNLPAATISSLYRLYFSLIASIVDVSRCVVSSNQITYESGTRQDVSRKGISFGLLDIGVPSTEIAITGNIFQGAIRILKNTRLGLPILPPRFPVNTVPSPMNLWEFLNTVS